MNKIIYLDAAASSLKPDSVIDAQIQFLRTGYANAGRGVCERATAVDNMVADVRAYVAYFINADFSQVVFTSGATDGLNRAINFAFQMCGCNRPVVAVSDLDHHSARLPWENFRGAVDIVTMPLDANFNIDILRVPRADVMVITAMSNVFGIAQDVAEIIRAARAKNPNVITIVDAAQYVAHCPIDVKKWDCDILCFSGHKIGADTGVGVMYLKESETLLPDKFGGGMVLRVDGDKIIPNHAPYKFEAGTLPLTQIIGLKPAIESLRSNPANPNLITCLYDELKDVPNIKILTGRDSALFTFIPEKMHVLDFGALVGAHGVCLRVGNMCASWAMHMLGINGVARISPGPWNTMQDIHKVAEIIKGIVK